VLSPYLRLLRVGTLFSPAADVLAGICLASAATATIWTTDAWRAMVASVCIYAAGMVLNDHADRALDARMRPERPLPSGQIAPNTALAMGMALMLIGVITAPCPIFHGALALLVLGYDYLLKTNVLTGAVTMGSLRGLNLCAGAVSLQHELPDRTLTIAACCYAIYIIAVTLLGALEDERNPKRRVVVSVQLVPPIVATLAFLGMPNPWPAAAIAGISSLLFLIRLRLVDNWSRATIQRSMTWLLLGTMLYSGLLCLAAGRERECLGILLAAHAARMISRRIMLT
jgi:4-hydroxybenzoate polyprenyltransferase